MTSEIEQSHAAISRSLELLWRGRGQRSRGPKPGLSLDAIVSAAVRLADREGLTALSMRRVAAELGVGTMSLYRYVPAKTELLYLMLDHVSAPSSHDEAETAGESWLARLERIGRETYRLYLDHPWLLQVNQSRPVLGPNSMLGLEYSLATLDGLSLTDPEKIQIIVTVDSYVTGTARHYVLLRQAHEETGITDDEFWEAQGPAIEEAMTRHSFPHLMRLSAEAFSMSQESMLDFGMERVLDGIASFVAACQASRPDGPPAPEQPPDCGPVDDDTPGAGTGG
ncbi:transcriptional regulator, TetR family [Streptomyces zhaozhouensis]|uniref:Transcriptional regulator, TetR family n=1 Tax=Streptomyces zhaozhouensis TaxID=1300267 RepID=A0A286DYC3_9ACTN|nr:TetR/AcrR family transcriptional regulator [Streptomyces zhaozhouensis]SOD63633.1 transcriptional regulator, TetR family [Streptomyces zhaozhouensis]